MQPPCQIERARSRVFCRESAALIRLEIVICERGGRSWFRHALQERTADADFSLPNWFAVPNWSARTCEWRCEVRPDPADLASTILLFRGTPSAAATAELRR